MARVHNFSAGPAALPESVLAEIADEMLDYRGCGMSVLEMSHRSPMYQKIIDDAEATLRRLLQIPDNYRVLFLQGGATLQFAGIPTFSPEHFARIEQKDTMKRKQFVKGMEQIAQEGAIQIFREVGGGMEEVVVGVVGVLQLEVLEYRLNTEYNVEIRMQQLPFEQLRWIQNDPDTYVLRDLDLTSDTKAVEDMKGNRLLLFTSDWAIRWAETHNETLKLSEFGNI